ncbi:MAG: SDR family NAD(P)-dependent oxidoreductase [Acidimicrobiales bacterium]|nr:SDR family NAD(P)-dependent oxidoreductase [Acidimicrobiales bacterium]
MKESHDLDGQVALVTGAASGIGLACARRYAEEGAIVIASDLADVAPPAVRQVSGIEYRRLDVADSGGWRGLVASIADVHGKLDIVHLNAGIRLGVDDITALSDDDYLRIVGVNQHGVFFGLRATVPLLEAGSGGAVIVTASRASLGPLPNDLAYSMSKHAVTGLVRSVAAALAARSISINAICPATVDTGFIAGTGRERLEAAGIAVMGAEEVAEGALVILAGDSTGQCFVQLPGETPEEFEFAAVPGR